MYPLLANLILVLHLAFVLFVLFGGLLVLKWRWIAWLHLPAATWGVVVECTGWICPLTPLEHWLRSQTGGTFSPSDSLVQYLLPALYPSGLTREIQILLGMLVLAVNLAIYGWLWRRTSVKTTRGAK